MQFLKRKGHSEPLDTVRFASSWLLPTGVLFFIRALISLYIFTSIFTILGIDNARSPARARHYFSYFTSLTFWGLAFYFAFAAAHTASYWRTGTPFLAKWPKLFQAMHSIYYTTITTYPFLVTIVFWAIIFDNVFYDKFDRWSNVSEHALNSVFALFEIIVPRTTKTPKLHIIPLIIILAMYLGLAYVTLAVDHFYVYDFLNTKLHRRSIVAAYIIGILVGTIIMFFIVHFLIKLRRWLTEDKMGKTGKLSSRTGYVQDVEARGLHLNKEAEMVGQPDLVK